MNNVVKLPVHGHRFALISEADAPLLKYSWCDNGAGYVVTSAEGKRAYLHRMVALRTGVVLAGKRTPIEHLNHDKYDCRRENLRVSSGSLNTRRNANGFIKNDSNGKWAYAGITFFDKHILVARTLKTADHSLLLKLAAMANARLIQMQEKNPQLTLEEVQQEFLPMITLGEPE